VTAGDALSEGLAAQRAGDLAAAEAAYRFALAADPADIDARNLLATVAFARADFAAAERLLRSVLADAPGDAPARFNLARVDEACGRRADALAGYAAIGVQTPQFPESRLRIAGLRYAAWELDAAAAALEEVRAVLPAHPLAGLNLGIIRNQQGRHDDAIGILRDLLAIHPGYDDARRPLADSLRSTRDLAGAEMLAREVLTRNPRDAQMLVIFGRALYDRGLVHDARRAFRAATELAPEFAGAWTNLNVVDQHLGELDAAIVAGERAIACAPDDAEAHLNLAMSYLSAGDFARGWAEFEWRLRGHKNRSSHPYLARLAAWDGTPIPGRRLVIGRDQGLGDFILHARFFEAVKQRSGAHVTLEAPPELRGLVDHTPVDMIVFGRSDPARANAFDTHVALGSIAHALGVDDTLLASVPVPYLRADPERSAAFRTRFAAAGKRRTVGIVWAGSPGHGSDRYRSCGLAAFGALAELAGIGWVSLQKGPREVDLTQPPPGMAIEGLGPELRTFADTAAAIAALDLVISVDTAVAHLAGALGAPVWTLLGFESYWLWRTGRTDTPWYPTMRLFRQAEIDGWDGVLNEVRAALAAWLGASDA